MSQLRKSLSSYGLPNHGGSRLQRRVRSTHVFAHCYNAHPLHRLFVRHVGENVTDYLGKLRIGRACMCLVETDRPISVVAADTGFPNLSNFNRRFRAVRQMSPKEFRRQYREHRGPSERWVCTDATSPIARTPGRRNGNPQARFPFSRSIVPFHRVRPRTPPGHLSQGRRRFDLSLDRTTRIYPWVPD